MEMAVAIPGDVADADGRGEGRGDGLEGRHAAGAVALGEHLAEDFAQRGRKPAELNQPGENGEQQARPEQQDDHRPAPDQSVQGAFEGMQLVHAEHRY